jgi:hypothetical protein
VTRTILAAATGLFAAVVLFVPAAEACISCNYTPEVVHSPAKPQAKRAPKARDATANKARPAKNKKRIVKTPTQAQPAPTEEAAAPKAAEPTTEPAPETVQVDTPAQVAPSGSATAALNQQAARAAEPEPEAEVGCKRYSAQAGTTVTVPCD